MSDKGIEIKIVASLPAIGENNIIYFVRSSNMPKNLYSKFIYLNNKWELFGKSYSEDIDKIKNEFELKLKDTESKLASKVSKKELSSELKSYTKTADISKNISDILKSDNYLKIKILPTSVLPPASEGEPNTLYLKPKSHRNKNNFYEYIWFEQTKTFELVGSRDIDIDAYVLKVDADAYNKEIDNKLKELYENKVNTIKIDSENSSILHANIDLNTTKTVKTYTLSIDKATIKDNKVEDNTKNGYISGEDAQAIFDTKVDTISSDENSIITIESSQNLEGQHESKNSTSVKIGITPAEYISGIISGPGYVSGTQMAKIYEDIKSSKLSYIILQELPEITAELCENEKIEPHIYLVKPSYEEQKESASNKLSEYILIIKEAEDKSLPGDSYFEKLGEIGFDAENYYTKNEIGRYIEEGTTEPKEFTEDSTVVNYIDTSTNNLRAEIQDIIDFFRADAYLFNKLALFNGSIAITKDNNLQWFSGDSTNIKFFNARVENADDGKQLVWSSDHSTSYINFALPVKFSGSVSFRGELLSDTLDKKIDTITSASDSIIKFKIGDKDPSHKLSNTTSAEIIIDKATINDTTITGSGYVSGYQLNLIYEKLKDLSESAAESAAESALSDAKAYTDGLLGEGFRTDNTVISNVNAINNNISGINDHLDNVDGHLNDVDSRLDGINDHLNDVDGRLDGIDDRLDNIDSHLDDVDSHLDDIDECLSTAIQSITVKDDSKNYLEIENDTKEGAVGVFSEIEVKTSTLTDNNTFTNKGIADALDIQSAIDAGDEIIKTYVDSEFEKRYQFKSSNWSFPNNEESSYYIVLSDETEIVISKAENIKDNSYIKNTIILDNSNNEDKNITIKIGEEILWNGLVLANRIQHINTSYIKISDNIEKVTLNVEVLKPVL